MNIKVPTFVLVITALTGLIATILGLVAWFAPEAFPGPSGVGAPAHAILSWGARELAMGFASWIAIFLIKDARGYLVVLGSAWLRETMDFIDGFRIADTPTRLFIIVGISVVVHSIAVVMTYRTIRKATQDDQYLTSTAMSGD